MFGIRQLVKRRELEILNRSLIHYPLGFLTRNYTCKLAKECGPCSKHQYMDPQCKVALVTGGATGIGLAIANELLGHHLYRVILGGPDPCVGKQAAKQLNDTHGKDKACFMHLNVNCSKQFEDVFKEITAKFGGVDILFNNAGIMEDKRWEYEIDTNMKSVVRGTLTAFKFMVNNKTKGGVVINTVDALAFEQFPYSPIYTASKYGVLGLSRCFGHKKHFKKTGVRVVGLCPGVTDTAMIKNSEHNQLNKELGKETLANLLSRPIQKATAVGKASIYLVQYAPTGSIWVVEDGQLYKANIPSRQSFSEKITQL